MAGLEVRLGTVVAAINTVASIVYHVRVLACLPGQCQRAYPGPRTEPGRPSSPPVRSSSFGIAAGPLVGALRGAVLIIR